MVRIRLVISRGWATSSLAFAGRALPDSVVSAAGRFRLRCQPVRADVGRLVEAVTEATCHSFKRNELKSFLFAHPELIEMLTRIRIEERKQSDQLITEETEKWGKVIRSASIKPE